MNVALGGNDLHRNWHASWTNFTGQWRVAFINLWYNFLTGGKMLNKPSVKLSGIEYLLVCMQSNPGQSQRYYLRRLHEYKWGRPDYHKGGTCCGYFTHSSYRGRLFEDEAPKNSRGRVWLGWKPKSSCAQMHLTRAGWSRANRARLKLGLNQVPFEARAIFA